MKKIFEDWKAYKQKCVDSKGEKGEAVVKKTGDDSVESCHKSLESAKDSVKARYANYKSESIEEMSSVGGGAVVGHANPDKKKNKKLSEMFSSSTQTGGVRISIVSSEKEHNGHVERSKHQGLRNIMQEDDDATIPMGDSTRPLSDTEPLPKPQDPVATMLEKNGYKLKKKLGEGQYGVVVLATEIDEYGGHDFAIKILKSSAGSDAVTREIRNYEQISKARDKNPMIAKHFPEVFKVFEEEGKTFIVMEVLMPLQSELKGLFSGVAQAMQRQIPMRSMNEPISKYDADKDISKRVENIFNDQKQLENLLSFLKVSLERYSTEFNKEIEPQIIKDIDSSINPSVFRNFRGVSPKKANEIIDKFQDKFISSIGDSANIYLAIMDDLKKSPVSKVFVALVSKKIVDIMKKYTPKGDNVNDFVDYILKPFLQRFQKLYRSSTGLKTGYSSDDFNKDGGRTSGAESIYQAISSLYKETGLLARDLHDGNAMRRPDGDIVIVDVGMFKTGDEVKQMKKGKLRENRIRIRIKR